MLRYDQAQDFANDPMDTDAWANDGPDDKQFFEFICKSYPPWLDGNDDMPSLDEELQQNFGESHSLPICLYMITSDPLPPENRNNANRAEIDNLTAIKDEVTAETEAIINAGV